MEYLACIHNVCSVEEGLNQVIFALIFVHNKTNNVLYDISIGQSFGTVQ